jgi:hypothetical protein
MENNQRYFHKSGGERAATVVSLPWDAGMERNICAKIPLIIERMYAIIPDRG